MNNLSSTNSYHDETNSKKQWERDEQVNNVVNFEQVKFEKSQRQFAESEGIPRTTLQHWLKRKENLNESKVVIQFFENSEGLAFLHRLLIAAHYEFTKVGSASIHNVCHFVELAGLSPFVANSYGTQQQVSKNIDNHIINFEQEERERLSKGMSKKKISLCEDETFHPDICAVAIEPISNFIIVEEYVEKRDGNTWNQVVEAGISGLPVEIIQVSSDLATGIVNHTKKGLGVHHSPDVFHVSNEVVKGTSVALSSQVKNTQKAYEETVAKTSFEKEKQEQYDNLEKRPVGRRPQFENKIAKAYAYEKQALKMLEETQKNQEIVKTAHADIGQVYHPYNLETGTKQDAQVVSKLLDDCFEKINNATNSLSERCKKQVDKAHRVIGDMRANIAFFFATVDMYLQSMNFSPEIIEAQHDYLIPGFYLATVAEKEKDLEKKRQIKQKSQELLSIFYDRQGIFAHCTIETLQLAEHCAKECAQFFQRSSSCVEGRNAQLSLKHHSLHRLSKEKLQALTAIHNYYLKRSDGTTPAERFFGAKPKDMFQYLLDHINLPARPRKSPKGIRLAA